MALLKKADYFMKYFSIFYFLLFFSSNFAQSSQGVVLEDILVRGNSLTSTDAIITISGLKIGETYVYPSPKVQKAIRILWEEHIFDQIEINLEKIDGKNTFVIKVREYLPLASIKYTGLSAGEVNKLNKNPIIKSIHHYSPYALKTIETQVKKMLLQKGYLLPNIAVESFTDSLKKVHLVYHIEKRERIKIGTFNFVGNSSLSSNKIEKHLKNKSKDDYAFNTSFWYNKNETLVKKAVENLYRENGFLDATVDSIYTKRNRNKIDYHIALSEGEPYFLQAIYFEGNTIFNSKELQQIFKPLLGKVYNQNQLEKYLFYKPNRTDITSLYLDNGYANFKLKYELKHLSNNKIEVKIKLKEGVQYVFGKINFKGNVRTKDKVLHQTVITNAGDLFSRAKIIISQQKLMQLGYFIPEKMDVEIINDTISKEVAVNYVLKEKISDQLLLSGGFDGTYLIGSLGFDFKNFELSDVFKKGSRWNPLPAGGGQHLSLKAQSDATNYYGFSFLFEEPRLKNKPMGASLSSDFAQYKNEDEGNLQLFSTQVGLSHNVMDSRPFLRLKHQINYRYYHPNNYSLFGFNNGFYNALTYRALLVERTTNNFFYPTKGHYIKLQAVTTAPLSFAKGNLEALSEQNKYKWLEYYKLKISIKHYLPVGKKNTLASSFGAGYLGRYNKQLDIVPFERFEMGGTGITNYSINANDIIGLRGYDAGSLSSVGGDPLAFKFSIELRRKLLSFEKWMLTAHLFYENGNTLRQNESFGLNHAFGLGSKIYIPLLGVVGIDAGWGVNKLDYNWKQPTVQFTIGLDVGDF